MLVRESIHDIFKGPSDPKIIKQYEKEKEDAEGFLEYIQGELDMINHGHIDNDERYDMKMNLYNQMDDFWYDQVNDVLQNELGEKWFKLLNQL